MTLADYGTLADIVAAFAIVATLGFVGWEVHMSRKQAELTNWRELLGTMTDHKAQTNDAALAALLVRGHADYGALSEEERLAFGHYLEQGVHVYGNFLKHNDSLPRKLTGLEAAVANHFWELLATPGGAAWWAEAHRRRRFMPGTYAVTDALLERRRARGGAPL